MILFRGLGFLAIIIPIALVIICQLLFGEEPYVAGIGYICSGLIVYMYGQKLNKAYKLRSADTKDLLAKVDADHSLFFVRMEYWGLIIVIFGLGNLFPSLYFIMDKVLQGFIIILVIVSAITGIKYLSQKYQNHNKKPTNSKPSTNQDSDGNQLTRREKLLGNTAKKEPSIDTSNKSEGIQKLKALRNQSDTKIESDHSKYKPQ